MRGNAASYIESRVNYVKSPESHGDVSRLKLDVIYSRQPVAHRLESDAGLCGRGEDQFHGGMRGDFIWDVAAIRLFYSLLGLKVMLLCCNSLSAGDRDFYFLRACACVCARVRAC